MSRQKRHIVDAKDLRPSDMTVRLGRVDAWIEAKSAFVAEQMRARRWVTR